MNAVLPEKRIPFALLFLAGALSFTPSMATAAGAAADLPKAETVFSRLIIINRCYRDVKMVTENRKGAKPRWIRARGTERVELWPGTRMPGYAYQLTRDDSPALNKTLKNFMAASEKTTKQLGDITCYDHTYTLCGDEAELEAPDTGFARVAKKGEVIDVFRIYLTQIPGSKDRHFAYKHYPVRFFLDNYPVFMTYSDNQGNAEILLAKGTQGRLGIVGHAFGKNRGQQLYREWMPNRSFTAKGGEMVYRIPAQKNPVGW